MAAGLEKTGFVPSGGSITMAVSVRDPAHAAH